ncbi:MAG TPA: TIGR02710 family CRISPR-associated protein [Archaeoglobaceae archaeon]|nr:TIGR02710 family CRISPR-associated protein [Archaeoglobaceae archaeon]
MAPQKVLFSTSGVGVGKNGEAMKSLAGSILKVIEHENPDKVVFFSTEEADKTIEIVNDLFKKKYGCELNYEIHHVYQDDFNACFSRMMEIASTYKEWRVGVNYTPGTKTMSAALAAVGAFLNVPIIYVSGKREKGIVKKGTEVVLASTPYKFRDILILRKVSELFNSLLFNSALIEARELVDYSKKDTLLDIIKGYLLWDSFNHEAGHNIFSKYSSKDVDFIEKFGINKGFLSQLIKSQGLDRMKFLLVDLISNAERRIKTARYDDAVARLYRAVELIAQIALAEFGYEEPIKLEGELAEKYKEYEDSGKFKLGLAKKMELLKDLGWNKADDLYLKNNRIKGLLESRNMSILAHGFIPVGRSVTEGLLAEVEKFSKNLIKKYNKLKASAEFGSMRF